MSPTTGGGTGTFIKENIQLKIFSNELLLINTPLDNPDKIPTDKLLNNNYILLTSEVAIHLLKKIII